MGDQPVGAGSVDASAVDTAVDTAAFDSLLTAPPVPDEGSSQLEPAGRPVFDFSDRADRRPPRATVPDWTAFALALLLPPIGFVASIAVRIWSYRRNGWTTGLVRSATVISAVLSVALGVAIVVAGTIAAEEAEAAQVAADARPLCEALDATPGMLELPAFGWPTERVAIPLTLEAMQHYQAQWVVLADVAPAPIAAGVSSIADAAQTIITSVESTQVLDRQRNLDQMTTITAQSGLVDWHETFCE